MAGPTRKDLAIGDPVLSNFALDYGEQSLVGNTGGMGITAPFIYPVIPHNTPGLTGEYYKYNFHEKIELADDNRAQGGNYNQVDRNITSATYRIEDKGLSYLYDNKQQAAALGNLNLSEDAASFLPQDVIRAWANDVITEATNSSNFNAGVANTAAASAFGGVWDTTSTDIVYQVAKAKRVIFKNCGVMPDRMVIGLDAWVDGILQNDNIIGGLQAMQRAGALADLDPNDELVRAVGRQFFGLDLAVDTGLYNNANPTATASPTLLFPKHALIFVSNKQFRNARALRFGFTAVRPGEFLRGYRWNEPPHGNWRAVSLERAIKLVADEAGYLITSVVS